METLTDEVYSNLALDRVSTVVSFKGHIAEGIRLALKAAAATARNGGSDAIALEIEAL